MHLLMTTGISVALYSIQNLSRRFNCTLLIIHGGLQILNHINRGIKRVWYLLKLTHLVRGEAGTHFWYVSYLK